MMGDTSTPEERLLKIIENSNRDKQRSADSGNKLDFIKRIRLSPELVKKINLRFVNRIMISVAGLLTGFLFIDFHIGRHIEAGRMDKINSFAEGTYSAGNETDTLKVNFQETLNLAKKRNIFSLVPLEGADITIESIQEEAQPLKLVGIIWSESNPQAMIEDTKEQKTYILSSGDYIGQLLLKKILRDKVIVGKADLEWELR